MTETGKLYVVGTPIGNLSDFSPRGIETLESVDYIAAEDTRVTLRLLTHFGIKKPLLSYYKPHEAEKSAKILELLHGGNSVALVSDAGMPCISDPGVYLVQRCYEQGVPVESVPCCNAAIAAVAISGIDTARFAFEGFLPVDKKERRQRLAETAKLPQNMAPMSRPVAESPQMSSKPISRRRESGYSINSYLRGGYSVFSTEKGSLNSPSWKFNWSKGR